jgi:hypothetical protein
MRTLFKRAVTTMLLVAVGCATLAPGENPVIVRAEQLEAAAFAVTDTFVKVEYTQRAAGASLEKTLPGITAAANKARVNGPKAIRQVHQVIEVYVAAKGANKADLEAALLVLNQLVVDVQDWQVGTARRARHDRSVAAMVPVGDILAIIEGLFQIYSDVRTTLATTNAADAQARATMAAKEEAAFASAAWQVSTP